MTPVESSSRPAVPAARREVRGDPAAPAPVRTADPEESIAPATDTAATRPAGEAQEEVSPLRSALSVLATLGPPITVITALMHYFGWARSDVQASAMGLDVTLFG